MQIGPLQIGTKTTRVGTAVLLTGLFGAVTWLANRAMADYGETKAQVYETAAFVKTQSVQRDGQLTNLDDKLDDLRSEIGSLRQDVRMLMWRNGAMPSTPDPKPIVRATP